MGFFFKADQRKNSYIFCPSSSVTSYSQKNILCTPRKGRQFIIQFFRGKHNNTFEATLMELPSLLVLVRLRWVEERSSSRCSIPIIVLQRKEKKDSCSRQKKYSRPNFFSKRRKEIVLDKKRICGHSYLSSVYSSSYIIFFLNYINTYIHTRL